MRKSKLVKSEEIDLAIRGILSHCYEKFDIMTLYKVWGLRLRKRRIELNLTQSDIAKMFNVTFQQVQKFENGTNKVSFDKLIIFCQKTGTGYDYFLQTLNGRTLINGGNNE
jgi:DNA-binding XRE family transcriptional regulator|tara:strand:+ start:49 stop:381 length:333 start_codon:yes stop_codon:yes gene_type:complete